MLETEQREFELKWHDKIVRLRGDYYSGLPDSVYLVTAALYKYAEDNNTILGLFGGKHGWFTVRIAEEDLEEALAGLELLPEGEATE